MNRQRNLLGANSYEKDLGFSPVDFLKKVLQSQTQVAWLDLCCGSGRALLQAASIFESDKPKNIIQLVGLDLIPMLIPSRGPGMFACSLHPSNNGKPMRNLI
jgi:hypothetical protein